MAFPAHAPNRIGQRKLAGHRICEPGETVARLRPKLETMGITRLADITGLDRIGIPVAQAVRPMGRSLSVAQGKGRTIEAALASAAMEAVETWHAEFADLELLSGSAADLASAGHTLLDLDALVPGRPPAPEEREARAREPIRWARGRDLFHGGTVLVPFDTVHLDLTRPADASFLPRSSNGLAGGNTPDEAIASALHEVIERDCMADFAGLDRLSQGARRIDVEDIAGRWLPVAWMIGAIRESGLTIELFDMTNDLGIPAVSARIYETPGGTPAGEVAPGASGAGCHLDPEIAVIRAITEAAQSRLTKISGVRDDLQGHRYVPSPAANFAERLHLMTDIAQARVTPFAYRDRSTSTAEDDIAQLVASLKECGISQAACVELTRADLGIPVVRVIVPGLGRKMSGGFLRGTRHHAMEVVQ